MWFIFSIYLISATTSKYFLFQIPLEDRMPRSKKSKNQLFHTISDTTVSGAESYLVNLVDPAFKIIVQVKYMLYRDSQLKQWCGSRGIKSLIKWREKQSNQQKSFFSQEIIFFKSEPKNSRCWFLLTATSSLNSYLKLTCLKIWWFYWPGFGLDPDLDWSNFVDPDPEV